VKISFGIIVVDGMPFIRHQLELLYPHAHQIIICEGGDDIWKKLHGHRNSQDETIDFIQSFPDPENKIEFIQKKWRDKNHMCHEYSKRVTGDIVWHIDVDEFVDPAHIPYLISLFKKFPEYDAMAIPQIVFWGDAHTVIGAQNGTPKKWSWKWFHIDRIYRYKNGMYVHHIPQRGYYDPISKQVVQGRPFPPRFFIDRGIYTYHFSYVFPQSVLIKMKYYNERLPNCIKDGWFDNVFMKFKENREKWIASHFDVQPINPETKQNYPYRIKPLDNPLPRCLKGLEEDIQKEVQP